jgi:hypothetical protein
MIGLDSMMPLKLVKLHANDAPWMTPYFKELIHNRQKALKENNILLFKFYRNRVNRERKVIKSKYYRNKVENLKHTEPKNGGLLVRRFAVCQNRMRVSSIIF